MTGYEGLVDRMSNHPKDRHVLAAAVHAVVQGVVTFNLADFDPVPTGPHGLVTVHPDVLLSDHLHDRPDRFLRALEAQVEGYRDPRMSVLGLASALQRCGCPTTTNDIRRRLGGPERLTPAAAPRR